MEVRPHVLAQGSNQISWSTAIAVLSVSVNSLAIPRKSFRAKLSKCSMSATARSGLACPAKSGSDTPTRGESLWASRSQGLRGG